jgi:hypothetical protein
VTCPTPTDNARFVAVWEGIRRTHGEAPEQALRLMPPELFDVVGASPTGRHFKTKGRTVEADLAGLRERTLLLVGFAAALRRSELVHDLRVPADDRNRSATAQHAPDHNQRSRPSQARQRSPC